MMYRTLLKTIRKMLNSLTLRQQHFLYQRKKLYDQESSRSSSGEIVPENLHENLQPEFFISALYRTLSEIAALPRVKLGIPAGRARWAPLQYKMEDERQKYAASPLSVTFHTLFSNFILQSHKVRYIIQSCKRKFFGAG